MSSESARASRQRKRQIQLLQRQQQQLHGRRVTSATASGTDLTTSRSNSGNSNSDIDNSGTYKGLIQQRKQLLFTALNPPNSYVDDRNIHHNYDNNDSTINTHESDVENDIDRQLASIGSRNSGITDRDVESSGSVDTIDINSVSNGVSNSSSVIDIDIDKDSVHVSAKQAWLSHVVWMGPLSTVGHWLAPVGTHMHTQTNAAQQTDSPIEGSTAADVRSSLLARMIRQIKLERNAIAARFQVSIMVSLILTSLHIMG
jgi:hypothetical protein